MGSITQTEETRMGCMYIDNEWCNQFSCISFSYLTPLISLGYYFFLPFCMLWVYVCVHVSVGPKEKGRGFSPSDFPSI